jgi:hypothetical protein
MVPVILIVTRGRVVWGRLVLRPYDRFELSDLDSVMQHNVHGSGLPKDGLGRFHVYYMSWLAIADVDSAPFNY